MSGVSCAKKKQQKCTHTTQNTTTYLLLGEEEAGARVHAAARLHAERGGHLKQARHGVQQLGRAARLEHPLGRVDKEAALGQHVGVEELVAALRDDGAGGERHQLVELRARERAQAGVGRRRREVEVDLDALLRALEHRVGQRRRRRRHDHGRGGRHVVVFASSTHTIPGGAIVDGQRLEECYTAGASVTRRAAI